MTTRLRFFNRLLRKRVEFAQPGAVREPNQQCMKSYVMRMSDAEDGDWESVVVVPNQNELPHAIQIAVQALLNTSGDSLRFPLFIDIHPAMQFEHVAWMHRN